MSRFTSYTVMEDYDTNCMDHVVSKFDPKIINKGLLLSSYCKKKTPLLNFAIMAKDRLPELVDKLSKHKKAKGSLY